MPLSTPLSERIGIEHPFMQAGMGGIGPITLARLAAAISEAGALGTLAQPALVLEEGGGEQEGVEEQVAEVVEQVRDGIRLAVSLTDKPLAINVRIAQEQPDAPHVLRAILEERERDPKVRAQLRVLTTSGGHPHMYGMNGDFRDAGMLHFHAVSNVRHALTAEREGVDGVIATGFEAAGHVGHRPVHTFVLVPSIAAAVDLPVLCAGGVVDGAALAGALTLGAEMGYIGSRFLASRGVRVPRGQQALHRRRRRDPDRGHPRVLRPGPVHRERLHRRGQAAGGRGRLALRAHAASRARRCAAARSRATWRPG